MNIKVLDNVFDLNYQTILYELCRTAPYFIGWGDSNDIELSNRPFFHSKGDVELKEMKEIDFNIKNTSFKNELENYKIVKSVINCSRPGETYWSHVHKSTKVVLYYPNFRWNKEWGGETMFYDKKTKDLIFCCEYKPNRIILFDGEIPHSVRAPTYIADQYRFTMSFFYEIK